MREIILLHTLKSDPSLLVRQFWSLLFGVTTMAVLVAGLALWSTANPFLRNQQNEAIQKSAEDSARNVEIILHQHRQILAFVASQKDIISVSMGYVENADILKLLLTDAEVPENLVWLGLYDAFGTSLAEQKITNAGKSRFSNEDINSLIAPIIDPNGEILQSVLLQQDGPSFYLLIATPVRNNGFTEGVVVGKVDLLIDDIFPPSPIIRSATVMDANLAPTSMDDMDEMHSAVASSNLIVSIVPDREHVALAGRQLLFKTIGAISLVMFTACGALAILGRRHIIAPHLKLQEQKRELNELASVARLASDSIIITDLEEKIVWTNPAFEKLSGYTLCEVVGRRPCDFLQGARKTSPSLDARFGSVGDGVPIKTIIENIHKSGHRYWISLTITPLTDEDGAAYGFMSFASDITDAKHQREELIRSKDETEFQAMHDSLTGLPNRRALDAALKGRCAFNAEVGTMVRIDLDHFKNVNDNMGHAAGDFVLCQVADILSRCIRNNRIDRPADLAVRLGGDEFVILLGFGASVETAGELSTRLLSEIRHPMSFEGKSIKIGASFGIASSDDCVTAAEDVLAGADAALYEAKENGRNRVSIYTKALHRTVQDRREMALELRVAIERREFEPYFQPQFDAKTDAICGVEVLARWPSKRLGMLTPDSFIPVAEQLSLMPEIDKILFEKAIEQIMRLHKTGIFIPQISFNVTAERLTSGELISTIERLGENRPAIAIEILESVLVEEESDIFHFQVDRLREAGVAIEIDDFGSGHTSIVGIMKLNPDVMKVDQRLILPIVESEQARGLLQQIIGMGKVMGLKVTAEGVETDAHIAIVKSMGCDVLQGYGLAYPMPIDLLEEFVRSREHADGHLISGAKAG
ncbi:MAG: diguanylate cyclase (GGDEF)-like protein/PAS domain S-box-containing protein [Yoonia sp.]